MNIIISGFFHEQQFQIIRNISEQIGFDYCLLLYHHEQWKLKCSNVEYLPRAEAYPEANYIVNWDKIRPLDEEIINHMADCEAQVLKMMDRQERDKIHTYPYFERKRLYLRHLRYWKHIIETKKIQLFLTSNLPHEIYDYIIYRLCRLKHIPVICLHQLAQLQNAVIACREIETNLIDFKKLNIACTNHSKLPTSLFKEGHALQNLNNKNPLLYYLKPKPTLISRTVNFFYNTALRLSRIKDLYKLIIAESQERSLFHYYDFHSTVPDLNKKYIYFPLHYQPELSTSPLAGVFVDQLLIIQLISYFLPPDVYLCVKEHPNQVFLGRSKQFYQDILKTRNVLLVSRQFESLRLVENCLAVVTCTGTAGWEALFRGKPVLMFGNYFYQEAPGVFRIHTKVDCENALRQIIQKKMKPTLNKMKIFMRRLERHAARGIIDLDYWQVSHISEKESTTQLTNLLLKEIRRIASTE